MTRPGGETFRLDAAAEPAYVQLFGEYVQLRDPSGRGGSDVVRSLGDLRLAALR